MERLIALRVDRENGANLRQPKLPLQRPICEFLQNLFHHGTSNQRKRLLETWSGEEKLVISRPSDAV